MSIGRVLCVALSLSLTACSGQVGDVGDGSGGGNGGGGGGGGGNGGGGGGGGGGAGIESCKRVDLVISVDDSGSMQEEMSALRNDVFPAFAQALRDVGGGLEDYRIGVIDACPQPASFHTRGDGGQCNFSSNQTWMESDSPRLTSEFSCVGDIYSNDNSCSGDNDDEQPASAAAAALESPMVAGNGPNSDFLRDDALLVVLALTDEDEQPTPNRSAQQVYDRLVALKGGNANKIVFLGIGGGSDCNGVYGSAENASMLKQVSGLFAANDQGLFWDLCNGRLEDGLAAAMGVIEDACDDFCNDPDGCDPGTGNPPDDPPGDDPPDECNVDNDCASGEFCEGGKCYPIIT